MKKCILLLLLMILSCVSKESRPENFSKINNQLYFGGSPESSDFSFLNSQGIRSIICVDGASPNLDSANKQNLVYRHIPITYGKISLEQQKMLAKAFNELKKPIYIHCHHGKHRGPAASAIVLKNHYNWKSDKLVEFMIKAGTSQEYTGLYKSVSKSKKMPVELWQNMKIPETAKVDALAQTMANLDRIWVKLEKQLEGETDKGLASSAQSNALLLKEYFIELKREPGTKFDEEYSAIVLKIKDLEVSLKSGKKSHKEFEAVKADCKSCHSNYRD